MNPEELKQLREAMKGQLSQGKTLTELISGMKDAGYSGKEIKDVLSGVRLLEQPIKEPGEAEMTPDDETKPEGKDLETALREAAKEKPAKQSPAEGFVEKPKPPKKRGDEMTALIILVILVAIGTVLMFFVMPMLGTGSGGVVPTTAPAASLNPHTGMAPGTSGFSNVRPMDWKCDSLAGRVQADFVNGAGQKITVTPTEGGCIHDGVPYRMPFNVSANGVFVCTYNSASGCVGVGQGSRFESTVALTWVGAAGGITHMETGRVWGAAE
jgi:hypothetical protein